MFSHLQHKIFVAETKKKKKKKKIQTDLTFFFVFQQQKILGKKFQSKGI